MRHPDLPAVPLSGRRSWTALAAGGLVLQCATAAGPGPGQLEELVPGFAYDAWFTDRTGFTVSPEGFAVYAMQPMGGTLYLGFGADHPAVLDGALLASFDHQGLHAIGALDEQGVLDMTVANEVLVIPGVDPCCPDGWEAGNVYLFRAPAELVKRRNLPNVLHAWGIWFDPVEHATYLAASAHPGDFLTSIGQLWRTTDTGLTWELVADGQDGVGSYRTYDVMGHHGALVAVARSDACTLATRLPGQTAWADPAPGRLVACAHRLVSFDGRLIALDAGRATLLVFEGPGAPTPVPLPFTVASSAYHWAATTGDLLYAVADDQRIMVTRDLRSWETVTRSDRAFTAIQYWPDRHWLVLATRGSAGALWRLRLCQSEPC